MIANFKRKLILEIMSSNDNTSELKNPQGLKFEDAVLKLNQIVERMESTEVDLDKMIENYQSGLSLLKFCQKKIQEAEFKLTELNTADLEQD
jgi:exodeoxyribonuclease VII small subunit